MGRGLFYDDFCEEFVRVFYRFTGTLKKALKGNGPLTR
jgi:hypothetical protein